MTLNKTCSEKKSSNVIKSQRERERFTDLRHKQMMMTGVFRENYTQSMTEKPLHPLIPLCSLGREKCYIFFFTLMSPDKPLMCMCHSFSLKLTLCVSQCTSSWTHSFMVMLHIRGTKTTIIIIIILFSSWSFVLLLVLLLLCTHLTYSGPLFLCLPLSSSVCLPLSLFLSLPLSSLT